MLQFVVRVELLLEMMQYQGVAVDVAVQNFESWGRWGFGPRLWPSARHAGNICRSGEAKANGKRHGNGDGDVLFCTVLFILAVLSLSRGIIGLSNHESVTPAQIPTVPFCYSPTFRKCNQNSFAF